MNELALFAGAGGGILGGHLLGWRTVCAVEWEPYPASVLCARQNDGLLPPFPIWDDVQTFDGKPWKGIVDVVSGGFPCQDISAAGKGAGIDGERSGMWSHMARVVSEVRPKYVFVENSPMLVTRGLERVLGDLTKIGYDTKWLVMGAADVGAPHKRDRIWILATDSSIKRCNIRCCNRQERQVLSNINRDAEKSESEWKRRIGGIGKIGTNVANTRCELWDEGDTTRMDIKKKIRSPSTIHNQSSGQGQNVSNSNSAQRKGVQQSERKEQEYTYACNSRWWQAEPNVGRMANGLASGVDRLKAIGNGQVPLCAATAWRILNEL